MSVMCVVVCEGMANEFIEVIHCSIMSIIMGGVSLYKIILLSLWLLSDCLQFPLYKLLIFSNHSNNCFDRN